MTARYLVHADESCLGNGREGDNPGGAGGLIEIGRAAGVSRRDYFLAEPSTTNNKMAIRSGIEALTLLSMGHGRRLTIDFVSDSEYLVKGVTRWRTAWERRDWRNVKNVELWQELFDLVDQHEVSWRWVRGHDQHPKNEYADYLATRAASEQRCSEGLATSGFLDWLQLEKVKGHYQDYDPDDLKG